MKCRDCQDRGWRIIRGRDEDRIVECARCERAGRLTYAAGHLIAVDGKKPADYELQGYENAA